MAKISKAECSKAGKALAKNGTSAAGKKLAHCRWHKNNKPAGTKKPKAKPKAKPAARKSRRIAGLAAETIRQPEPRRNHARRARRRKQAVGAAQD